MKRAGILLVTFGLLGGQTARSEAPDPQKPVLVHRTKECLVHATPVAQPAEDLIERGNYASGWMLLLTTLESGEMKVLSATASWSVPTRRISYRQTRLLGVIGDAERLYVLIWDSGRVFDSPPPPASQKTKAGTYQLFVFWLGDGSTIVSQPLTGDLPAEVPVETAEKGPLQLVDGGVSCFGTTVKFKGKQSVK